MLVKRMAIAALAAGLMFAGNALAGRPGPGEPSDRPPPWMKPNFPGYYETVRPSQPPPAVITAVPMKYRLVVASVPGKAAPQDADRVVLMAHVAVDALVWIDGAPTTSTGVERFYRSSAVEPGKEYHYAVRVAWTEDGHWVSKEVTIPVKAGEEHCFFVQKAVTQAEKDAEVEANLAKLSPEDRKLAEAQKFCVVENDTRLGAVGVPLKVMVKDKPVFVCCEACLKQAKADPDKTLSKVKELKAKAAEAPLK
jgi:uncharacterized protein (TIGR03000 family)